MANSNPMFISVVFHGPRCTSALIKYNINREVYGPNLHYPDGRFLSRQLHPHYYMKGWLERCGMGGDGVVVGGGGGEGCGMRG